MSTHSQEFTIGRAEAVDDRRHEPTFAFATVRDAMHPGILTCSPDATLPEVARMMDEHQVHCVAVLGMSLHAQPERLVWGIVSDIDLVRAAHTYGGLVTTAAAIAATEPVTIDAGEPLALAAQLMGEHDVHHLVVVAGAGADAQPVGIVSSLDVAGVVARSA